jgi:hypothetical protein
MVKIIALKQATYDRLEARLSYSDTFDSGIAGLLNLVEAVERDAEDYPSILLRIKKQDETKFEEQIVA